jgi:hypothetical protein
LLVAGSFWEKSTAGWWLISRANRVWVAVTLPVALWIALKKWQVSKSVLALRRISCTFSSYFSGRYRAINGTKQNLRSNLKSTNLIISIFIKKCNSAYPSIY